MDPRRVVIDTVQVIAHVRARPQIWQPAHALYKSRDARAHAWGHIAHELVPAFDEYSRADQHQIEKKIQQRWRTARDSFVKARAHELEGCAGAGAVTAGRERNYGYYDEMQFLVPTLRPPLKLQLAAAPAPAAGPARRRRRLRAALAAAAAAAARPTPLAEDDDDFFKSLAPMLRALRTEQKLSFRSRVLALALQVQAEAGAGASAQQPDSHYHADLPLKDEEDPLETKYCPPSPDSHL